MRRSRLFLLAGLALLLLAMAGFWQWRLREANGGAALRRGLAALEQGDARTARVELLNAVRADPRSATARIAQARALVDLGDGADAQAAVARARALGGSTPETRDVMAQALFLQGDLDGAVREAGAPDVPDRFAASAARVLARAAMARNDMNAAGAALERALRLAPGKAETWVDIGRFRDAIGDQVGAIAAADRAVTLAPASARALGLRAELVRDQYGLVASLPWFERALAANADALPVLEQYAATLADAGQAGRMLSVTRRILALDPANARAWFMQAVMAARAGKVDLARALLARTGGRVDGDPATLLLRGVLHLQDGNAVLATDVLGALVRAQPNNRVARRLLARANYATGDYPAAAAALAPIVAQRDADPYSLTLAGRVQEAIGNRTMANDMLARAVWPVRASADAFAGPDEAALAEGPPPVSAATARDNIPYIAALLRTGRGQEAVDRAALLSRANPGAPAAWIVLGDALDAAGRSMDSARAYEAAANIRFDRNVALRLAAAWGRAGDPARAAQVVQLFLAQNPDDVDARRLAAAVAMDAQDWRGALRLLQAVRAQIGDNDAVLMADLARAALESGDGRAARVYAAHAYRLLPGNAMTADIYGWTLFKTGKAERAAVDLLEKAVALAPRQPVLRMHLEQAYAAIGRRAQARPYSTGH